MFHIFSLRCLFYFIYVGLVLFLTSSICVAQSRQELENKKKNTEQEIVYTNKLIEETQKSKKDSYYKLLLLNAEIKQQNLLIEDIEHELNYIDQQLTIHQDLIFGLEEDLLKLKKEYARIIYYSYINRSNYNKLMFVLSAETINQGYKRLKYIKQYSEYRQKQAMEIVSTKDKISNLILDFEKMKAEKATLLGGMRKEKSKLNDKIDYRSQQIEKLTKQEKDLKKKLKEQQKIAQKLQDEIARIIAEEARLAAERAKKANNTVYSMTPEEQLLAEDFEKNKSRLPWPTERGVVTDHFGEHYHPVLKGIMVRNDGVDISTTEGSVCRAVFDGFVSAVFFIPGANKTVIIRHGNYLTVYSNLDVVNVKKGDKVSCKQNIGVIYTDKSDDFKTILKFQVWKENNKLNPELWLAKGKN